MSYKYGCYTGECKGVIEIEPDWDENRAIACPSCGESYVLHWEVDYDMDDHEPYGRIIFQIPSLYWHNPPADE